MALDRFKQPSFDIFGKGPCVGWIFEMQIHAETVIHNGSQPCVVVYLFKQRDELATHLLP